MYHIPSNKRSTCMFLLQPHNTLWNQYHHAHFAYEKVKAERGSLSFPKAHSLYGNSEPVHLTSPHFGYVICNLLVYITGCVRAKLLQSCPTATPWTIAHQAPQSMGFSRQKNWSGSPCPPPGDPPDPGIEPTSLTSPALAGGLFFTSTTWEALTSLSPL